MHTDVYRVPAVRATGCIAVHVIYQRFVSNENSDIRYGTRVRATHHLLHMAAAPYNASNNYHSNSTTTKTSHFPLLLSLHNCLFNLTESRDRPLSVANGFDSEMEKICGVGSSRDTSNRDSSELDIIYEFKSSMKIHNVTRYEVRYGIARHPFVLDFFICVVVLPLLDCAHSPKKGEQIIPNCYKS